MTGEEVKMLVQWAKAQGVKRIKTGEVEVEFAEQDDANADMMQVFEKALDQGRQEILARLSDEQRAQIERSFDDALTYGSS